MPASSKRKFKVVYCSSESPKRPVRELYSQTSSTKGWRSARLCEYPQELGFQFETDTTITQIQFLSHQHKIASKIELFIGSPDPVNLPAYESAIWKRLGYLSLDSNARTQYKARELKSVHIQATGVFLKVLLHKCHINVKNLYSQVGLIAVNIIGHDGSSSFPTALPRPVDAAGVGSYEAGESSTFDSQIVHKIKELNRAKIEAVEVENYELAKRLKQAIEQLKAAGLEISRVEHDKQQAVAREDFDAAVAFKRRIDAMRAEAIRAVPDYPRKMVADSYEKSPTQLPAQSHPARARVSSAAPGSRDPFPPRGPTSALPDSPPVGKPAAAAVVDDDRPIGGARNRPTIEDNRPIGGGGGGWKPPPEFAPAASNERPLNGRRSQTPSTGQQDSLPAIKNAEGRGNTRGGDVRNNRHFDDEPLPALKSRDGQQQGAMLEEFPAGASAAAPKPDRPEPIPDARRPELQELLTVFGEDIVTRLVSKTWTFRESAMKDIDTGALRDQFRADQEDMVFRAYCRVLERGFSDKITNVYYASLRLLLTAFQNVFGSAAKQINKKVFNQEINEFVSLLLEKTGDTNTKTKELSLKSALFLAKQPSVGPAMVLSFATRPQKKDANWRSLVGKLDLLALLAQAFGFRDDDDSGLSLNRVMEFAVEAFDNTNPEVRTAATAVVTEAYRKCRDDVRPFVLKMKQAVREPLLKKLEAEETGDTSSLAKVRPAYDLVPNGQPAASSTPRGEAGEPTPPPPEEPENECQFCGQVDPNWHTEELDAHMMKDCPMLFECSCDQVIEIATLNEHRSSECDNAGQFQACATCSAAIPLNELPDHACTAPPHADMRCPLCQADLDPADSELAWKKHLIEHCQKNPRRRHEGIFTLAPV